ncbi:hypothetical protein Tco_0879654, partial [Tanacetum coccineum]
SRSIKVKEFQRSFRHSDTERLSRSDEVLKLKNFKKDGPLKLFKSTNHERYEHVDPEVTSSQDEKPLEFSVGDFVLLKVSLWKCVVRFGKKEKLAPRFVGPFEIIEKVGTVAYRLDLPEKLKGVHDTFHVSNLKKCLADPTLQVPFDEIRVDAELNFVEEPL